MPQIKFMKNWNNKLNCDYFTTIKIHTHNKFKYYLNNLNKEFDVILKGKKIGKAILEMIETEYLTLTDITNYHYNYTDAGLQEIPFYNHKNRKN